MNRLSYFGAALLLWTAVWGASGIWAQDEGEKPKPMTVDPANPEGAEIPLEDLESLLLPLTKDEIKTEINAWMGLLKAKVKEIGEKEIEIRHAKGDLKDRSLEEKNLLVEQRNALISRVNVVLDAFQEKGGDAADMKQYVAAVSGLKVEVTDANAVWITVLGWLKSKEGGIRWGLNIVKFLVVLVAFWILARILARITFKGVSSLKKTSALLRDFFVNSVRRITIFIGIVIALSMLEVEIGPFLAAIGVVGFVVGFALQDTLSNFASGIMLLIYRPYDIGDVVKVAGVLGVVDAMSLVSTTIKTFDNQNIVVPNSKIWGDTITNITANDTRRVDMTFGIGYADDIEKAQSILEDVIAKHKLVLAEPKPVIKLHELADSSVNFIVRPWCKGSDYWDVYWDVTKAVKERFDKEGVSIPFPQRDIHVYQENGVS